MTTSTEYAIEALRRALDVARTNVEQAKDEPYRPWKDDPGEKTDNVRAAKDALRAIQDQIIDLEHQMRDPEQDAEMRMELQAEMWLTGVHDDVNLYFHTPMQEELFQEGIRAQIDREWMDEHGGPFKGNCSFCGAVLWDDEVIMMHGESGCETCEPDIKALFIILCLFGFGQYVCEGRWGEWDIRQKVGESDVDDE